MNNTEWALDIFNKLGIKTKLNNEGKIIISHYSALNIDKETDENKLIENVVACSGKFDTKNSNLTEFPLTVCQELILDKETKIETMPNLKAVGNFFSNENLKKLPKLKAAGTITLDNSKIKSLPRLEDAGVLIVQNSELKELPSLIKVNKLCVVDSPLKDLKSLKTALDIFICSSDEKNKIDILTMKNLLSVNNLFVANAKLKSLASLKSANKIALYNCEIKNVKSSLKADVEIKNSIDDDELAKKFEQFLTNIGENISISNIESISDIANM